MEFQLKKYLLQLWCTVFIFTVELSASAWRMTQFEVISLMFKMPRKVQKPDCYVPCLALKPFTLAVLGIAMCLTLCMCDRCVPQ